MTEGFGERLRKQREARQIDLVAIAEQTKIKRSLLEALERDDVSHWPSGIFRRAYIRSYAQMIGLDPDVVVREFLHVHPEPVDALEAAAAAAIEEAGRRGAAPPMRIRAIVDSAIGSLARLRRPGALDAPTPAGTPPNGPARAAIDRAPISPQGSAAIPAEDAPAVTPDYAPQPSPDPQSVDPGSDMESGTDAPQPAAEPFLDFQGGDAGPDQAGASSDIDVRAQPSDETRALFDSRLEAVAHLCTEFGRATGGDEILMLLADSARTLDATGLIVWLWDETSAVLRPALVHGYSDHVLAHLPTVRRDADNATAEAFRSVRPCEVTASAHATGALVVPLVTPEGCAGVLAVELEPGLQPAGSLRALATVLAAALAQLAHRSRPVAPRTRADRTIAVAADSQTSPSRHPRTGV